MAVTFNENRTSLRVNGAAIIDVGLPFPLSGQGRVGLSSWRCGGVAFDKVMLLPESLSGTSISAGAPQEAFLFEVEPPKAQCSEMHILDRRAHCNAILGDSKALPTCIYNYCDVCCKSTQPHATAGLLSNILQFDVFKTQLSNGYSQCLLVRQNIFFNNTQDCAPSNWQAEKSMELLATGLNACTRSGYSVGPVALNTTSCTACCKEHIPEVRLADECEKHCSLDGIPLMIA